MSHTVRQGQRAFMQTKQPLCEISQTKVNMFSRYRRVQQVYRENNVWDGGKEYSRVPEHTVSFFFSKACANPASRWAENI